MYLAGVSKFSKKIPVPLCGTEDFVFPVNRSGENGRPILSAFAACPARPVAPSDGTGVAPGDVTGVYPARFA